MALEAFDQVALEVQKMRINIEGPAYCFLQLIVCQIYSTKFVKDVQ